MTASRYLTTVLLSFILLVNVTSAATANRSFHSGSGLDVVVNTTTGAATISVDHQPWIALQGGMHVEGWGSLDLVAVELTHNKYDGNFGNYTSHKFHWQGSDSPKHVLETSFLIFEEGEMIIFEQTFPSGWVNPNSTAPLVAGFPSINPHLLTQLGFLVWGDCFLTDARSGVWNSVNDNYGSMFNGHTHGQPWLLHNDQARSLVWSSMDNFFVSGFAYHDVNDTIYGGLRTSLHSIPEMHSHVSVLVAGQGINATLMQWGDVLLNRGGGKKRAQVYDDFVLAHAGYFTDNGAYHFQGAHEPEYANMEEALLGLKNGFKAQQVPIRYFQWDDWWMENEHDLPGMLSWTPLKTVFPSGFTDWLDTPLCLYAPGYSARNVWINDYSWKTVPTRWGPMSIPEDPRFYMDLFRNGTQIGMKLFEQDFLCSYGIGGTDLTSTDVDSGRTWLTQMDQAAQAFNVTLQLCMANAYHLLQSTTLPSVSNARATYDNTRNAPSVLSMGPNSLLFRALGIFASRDNIWTSYKTVEQTGCGGPFCFNPNAHLDNAVTVLSNGPYGIADGVRFVNRTIVMYGCRTDGWMLRPRLPLGAMDFTYTDRDAESVRGNVWAAHDDYGAHRWSYIIGIKVPKQGVAITPQRLVQGALESPSKLQMVAWKVIPGEPVARVEVFSDDSPLLLPESESLDLPYDVLTPTHTHYSTAPVLSNGMVILGEVNKWATMSFGRVTSLKLDADAVIIDMVGAPAEEVDFAYIRKIQEDTAIRHTTHTFSRSCTKVDRHGNPICEAQMKCTPTDGCVILNSEATPASVS